MTDTFTDYPNWHTISINYSHKNWGTTNKNKKSINLHFSNNEDMKVIVGLNGSGKTVLLKTIDSFFSLIGGFNHPDVHQKEKFIADCIERGVSSFEVEISYSLHYLDETGIDGYRFIFPQPDLNYDYKTAYKKKEFYEYVKNNLYNNYNFDVFEEPPITYDDYLQRIEDTEFFSELEDVLFDWYDWIQSFDCKTIHQFDFENEKYESDTEIKINNKLTVLITDLMYETFNNKYECKYIDDDPFGANDFNSVVDDSLEQFEKEHSLRIEKLPTSLFPRPRFDTIYVSPEEYKEPNIPPELFNVIDEVNEIDTRELELILNNKTSDWILERVEAKQNQLELPTFRELANPHSGSIEIFVDKEDSVFCEENNVIINTNGIKINNFTRHPNHKKYIDVMGKFDKKTVWIIEIPKHAKYQRTLLGDNRKIFRYMKDVIYWETEGLIYSKNRTLLSEFIQFELFRHADETVKVEVLSRIFGVNSKELHSLYKVKSLGTSLSNHLTSGQKRIFTIFKSVSNSDKKILLIDEPEVSLHIDWQRQVIDRVRELSRSSMKLIATHSPDVIYHHHENVIDLPPSDEE